MSDTNNHSPANEPHRAVAQDNDEGGLRAPPGLKGWRKAWWWFDFIILVKLARLRFIGILAVIGVIITQWDTLTAYYDKWTRPEGLQTAAVSGIEYFCPMHPSIIRDNAKDKCPICFMPLSKRKKGSGIAETLPDGIVNRVQLTPYRVVLAGVHTSPIDYQALTKQLTAVGYVEFDERGQRTVSARVAGRIDKLVVNETGQMVEAGDELAQLYSPELNVTVENLLDAKRTNNQQLLSGARTRLERLGIDDAQLDDILAAGVSKSYLRIRSPIDGHVITKYVREGQYVEEGTPLYEVADLATVWIQAQIYEDDLAFLPIGDTEQDRQRKLNGLDISAITRAFPGEVFHGKLAFIYPHVDQGTRTVTVRFELDNPGHKLRPGSTASVTLKVAPKDIAALSSREADQENLQMLAEGRILAVPESAIIDTGDRKIVYRQTLPNTFDGVEVAVGPSMSDAAGATYYPVQSGLSHGDAVVTSGSFLVDAETRLNPAAGSIYFGGSAGSQDRSGVTTVRPSTPEDPDAKINASLARMPPEDRTKAEAQRFCPVLTTSRLGSMGTPLKLMVAGEPVYVCCAGCKDNAMRNTAQTLARVRQLQHATQE